MLHKPLFFRLRTYLSQLSLIEILIVVAMVCIFGSLLYPTISGNNILYDDNHVYDLVDIKYKLDTQVFVLRRDDGDIQVIVDPVVVGNLAYGEYAKFRLKSIGLQYYLYKIEE